MNRELKWKLDLRNSLQQTINSFRATKKEMENALNSGLNFENDCCFENKTQGDD